MNTLDISPLTKTTVEFICAWAIDRALDVASDAVESAMEGATDESDNPRSDGRYNRWIRKQSREGWMVQPEAHPSVLAVKQIDFLILFII